MTKRLSLIGLFLLLAAGGARANDIENGERLARLWCSSCHVVSSAQTRVENNAPNFSTIGRTRNMTESDLAQSLLAPHPKMPDRGLTRDEAADIAAYIRSFKNR